MSEQANMAARYEREIPEGYEARIEGNKVIFELKESEDERIRKEIVEYFKHYSGGDNVSIKFPKWIAYLEKQKEYQKFRDAIQEGDKVTRNQTGELVNLSQLERVAKPLLLEYPKEQKPKRERKKPKESWLEKSKYELAHEEELLIKRQKELSEIRALKNKEHKPAEWSLPKDFEEAVYKVANFISPFDSQDELRKVSHCFAEQLMSLAKKELMEKPAEWSEEDEVMLKEIISFFKDGSVKLQHDLDLYAGFLEKKLKSLRPQPHWKPSEEQMKALNTLLCTGDFSYIGQATKLQELYIELKKL